MRALVARYFTGINRVRYPLGVLVALVVADGLITQFLITRGLGREGNPFLQDFIGEQSFLIIKIVGAILCAFILWDIYKRQPKMALISSLCFIALYVVIVGWNLSIFVAAHI